MSFWPRPSWQVLRHPAPLRVLRGEQATPEGALLGDEPSVGGLLLAAQERDAIGQGERDHQRLDRDTELHGVLREEAALDEAHRAQREQQRAREDEGVARDEDSRRAPALVRSERERDEVVEHDRRGDRRERDHDGLVGHPAQRGERGEAEGEAPRQRCEARRQLGHPRHP
ncbi:MAG: hypothetical protein M5U28_51420 [Sandaracinaceae bacterium]|nr:hypothetical protein [Sandaracinaceae bacterium]